MLKVVLKFKLPLVIKRKKEIIK